MLFGCEKKKDVSYVFFPGLTFNLVFIGRLSLAAACFCRFSLIFWCLFRSFPAAMAESGETLRT